jgi:hypothetical protein
MLKLKFMIAPIALVKQPQIDAVIAEVVEELSPSVRHIRYDIHENWAGELALFIRVVLSDEASNRENMHELTELVRNRVWEKLDLPNLGLFPYFNFRSESQQAELKSPEWAAVN